VGAPKTGTSAMNRYLARHPDIFMAKKELHYFSAEALYGPPVEQRDLTWYLNEFAAAADQRLLGEASVFYLSSDCAAKRIKAFDPHAKIIIHVRNPADLVVSHHSEMLYWGFEDIADFRQALEAEDRRRAHHGIPRSCPVPRVLHYSEIARLADQVEHFLAIFGRANVLINVFDDFVENPALVYRKTLAFLGADQRLPPAFSVVNSNKIARSGWLRRFLSNPPKPIKLAAKQVLPTLMRAAIGTGLRHLNTRYVPRAATDPQLMRHLKIEFAADVQRLSDLLGRDLTCWSR
jgi:hypothetical protein